MSWAALTNAEARKSANGTVNRLASWLIRRLDGISDLDRVGAAVQVIRDVRALRAWKPNTALRRTNAEPQTLDTG